MRTRNKTGNAVEEEEGEKTVRQAECVRVRCASMCVRAMDSPRCENI